MQKNHFPESLCPMTVSSQKMWAKLCLKWLPSEDILDKDDGIILISIPNYPLVEFWVSLIIYLQSSASAPIL